MAQRCSRVKIMDRLNAKRNAGKSLLFFGAGSGLAAKCGKLGGADVICIYSTAVMRMNGLATALSLMPYGDCNRITFDAAAVILPLITEIPFMAGVGAHDPRLDLNEYLDKLASLGFSGVVNEPFVAGYGTELAAKMDHDGMGFSREVQLIASARKKDLFTLAWCTSLAEVECMAKAGADVVGIVLFGQDASLDIPLERMTEMCHAARHVHKDIFVICHGSPFNDLEGVSHAVRKAGVDGCATGSNGERIPAEKAIIDTIRQYTKISKT